MLFLFLGVVKFQLKCTFSRVCGKALALYCGLVALKYTYVRVRFAEVCINVLESCYLSAHPKGPQFALK